jgi:hypothetical protein
MPNILMQGKWKDGNSGSSGHWNSTEGISGRFQMMMGAQRGQGRIIGTMVVEESDPVVVSHSFVVMWPV